MKKTALIVGATGLIGKELLTNLLQEKSFEKVIIWVRQPSNFSHPKLVEHQINFNELSSYQIPIDVTDVFCTLGTTIKKAKSKEAFRIVDYTYPLELAKLTTQSNATGFYIVTAIGSNSTSPFFYSRTKGEIEDALKTESLPSLHIFRPSLLLGERNEFRFGEKMSEWFFKVTSFLFIGSLKKYKPVYGQIVARAMIYAAKTQLAGIHIHESSEIQVEGSEHGSGT